MSKLADDTVKYLLTNPREWKMNIMQRSRCYKLSINSIIALALNDVISKYTPDEKAYIEKRMNIGWFMRILRIKMLKKRLKICNVYRSRNGKKLSRRLTIIICYASAQCPFMELIEAMA